MNQVFMDLAAKKPLLRKDNTKKRTAKDQGTQGINIKTVKICPLI